jgi:hypothetical protein
LADIDYLRVMSSETDHRPQLRRGVKRGPYSHLNPRAAYNARMEDFALRHPAMAMVFIASLLGLLAFLTYTLFTM